MQIENLVESDESVNSSFKKVPIDHVGIDGGFFCYMKFYG